VKALIIQHSAVSLHNGRIIVAVVLVKNAMIKAVKSRAVFLPHLVPDLVMVEIKSHIQLAVTRRYVLCGLLWFFRE
jgi:hypothetical protein